MTRYWGGVWLATIAVLVWVAAGCGGSTGVSGSPCQMICEKRNSCATTPDERVPCDQICVYGGNYGPGLAPSPVCPNLAAQTSCVQAAVQMSCEAYSDAAFRCPPCGVLDGAPCASNIDCQKYQPNYLCDVSRLGGYCTAPCMTSDDCSIAGPEICATTDAPPSFAMGASPTQRWCLLGCNHDEQCRASEGYGCLAASGALGTCDAR
jgi:hypothetical protein